MDHLSGVEYFIQCNPRDHFDVALKLVFCDSGLLYVMIIDDRSVYYSKGKIKMVGI